jgi:hypothetical protein
MACRTSPQVTPPRSDIQAISIIFTGLMITVDSGKLRAPSALRELADQTADENGGQSFLPRLEVVCPCNRLLYSGSPLLGGAGLGLIGCTPTI